MIGLLVFALGGSVLGTALSVLLRRRFAAPSPPANDSFLEAMCAATIGTAAVWVATSWLLAIPGVLFPWTLEGAGGIELLAGGALLLRARALTGREFIVDRATLVAALIAIAPLVLWVAFVFWRGTLLPVYNNDALAYHFPKAVMLARAHAFQVFDVPEARIATWPCNYELLLSDVLLLTGQDQATAAIGTLTYLAFILFAARIAEEWWGPGVHLVFVAVLTGGVPIAILHSGLHKNDLAASVLFLGTFMWTARWFTKGCISSLVLAITAMEVAAGTKVNAAFAVLAALPFVIGGIVRHRPRLRIVGPLSLATVLAAPLVGAWPYLANLRHFSTLVSPPELRGHGYGDFTNIAEYTYMVLASPFAGSSALWNPFRHCYWWWPVNDVWVSNFGAIITVLVALLVPSVLRYRRDGARGARAATSAMAALTYALTLPLHVLPFGYFNAFGRYLVFIVPIVCCWVVSPAVLELERRCAGWRPAVLATLGSAIAASFSFEAWQFGIHDGYAPIELVIYQLHHPSNRAPSQHRERAGLLFDKGAPPDASCAFDVAFDTWIYPAYGANLTRRVQILPRAEGPVPIPPDVDWVIIDRSWNVIFGHPEFTDMSKAAYLGRGKPTDDDVKVYRQLKADPRFELVGDNRSMNQALFRRRPVSEPETSLDPSVR